VVSEAAGSGIMTSSLQRMPAGLAMIMDGTCTLKGIPPLLKEKPQCRMIEQS
jgi:hypothetical protein